MKDADFFFVIFLQSPDRDDALGPPGHGGAVQVADRVQLGAVLRLPDRHEAQTSAEEASS